MSGDEAKGKKPSPGRYSLASEGSKETPAVRPPKPLPPPPLPPPLSRPAVPKLAMLAFPGEGPASARAQPPAPPAAAPPPPPPPRASSAPPSPRPSRRPSGLPLFAGDDGFDEGSLAHAFDMLMSEGDGGPGRHQVDLTPVRELFAELAAGHMRHVRDFMMDVEWGEATRDWIEFCLPAVTSLRRAAMRLDLEELATSLDDLALELNAATTSGGRTIMGEPRTRILDAYGRLVALLPQAFALARDRAQREAVIVQTLLLQIPDVRKVTIDKLHAAGLTSLDVLFGARADELAQVAGIPLVLAMRIVEAVARYRREVEESSPKDARAVEREKLAVLTARLREHHGAYEAAANGWSTEARAEKRARYLAREEAWLAISLLLARFGEVDTLQGIEKVPFAQRITLLTAWLEEAADRYRFSPDA